MPDDDNGILSRVSAESISRALDMMPDPYAGAPGDVAIAVVKVLELGDGRITAVLKRNPRWKQYRVDRPASA
jgi:hypothetical protein